MFDLYPQYEEWFARVQLICFMLGLGVTLTIDDFLQVFRKPRSFLFGLVGQVCVVPLVAVALNHLFDLEPRFAVGMILVAAMPGGGLSKMFTFLGRGNAPLSITLTAVTTLATLATVPLTLHLLASEYVPDFEMPVALILLDVVVFLLLPVVVGMALRARWPGFAAPLGKWAIRIGFVFIAAMIVGALGSGRIRPAEYGMRVPLAIILFCLLGQQLNMVPFYVLRLPRADRMAVGIEVTMRNMNLALLLNASLFPEDGANAAIGGGALFVILFYAATAMICGIPLVLNHRRLARRETPAATPPFSGEP